VSDVVEKNIDSSSKSNPLRSRIEKNYDASTKMKNVDELSTKVRVIYLQQ